MGATGTGSAAGSLPGRTGERHGWAVGPDRRVLTAATWITAVRTLAAVGLALGAATADDRSTTLRLLVASLAVYWVGDVLDGAVARWRDQETRFGAVFDIVCDRACALCFYAGVVWFLPALALPVGVYVLEFAVVDTVLSLAFLAWPLLSPNYFDLVDRTVWLWNWSVPAKAVNSSVFALLLLWTESVLVCTPIAVALLVLKTVSLVRLVRLGVPVPATRPTA